MDAGAPAWQRALAHVTAQVEQRGGGPPLDRSLPVTVHLHPDRLVCGRRGTPRPLLAHLADDGTYRSQFETGTSNGGLTAHPGGDRWRWESRLFGGAYDDRPAAERPVYGALDRFRRPAGGSVRFGSCHLRLSASVLDRFTSCYPDSSTEPTDVGTAAAMPLLALAERVGYRGPAVVEVGLDVARQLTADGWLDAAVVGRAVALQRWDPQDLKRVWHCLARFGGPTTARGR